MIIVARKLIVDGGFDADVGMVYVCRIDGNNKFEIESEIVEALNGAGVGDAKKVLTRASLGGVKNADTATNVIGTDKVVAARGSKGEVGV